MAITFYLLAVILYVQSGFGYEFDNSTDSSGIFTIRSIGTYVTYDQWRLVYYIDLSQFHDQTRELNKCVKRIETLCSQVPDDQHCTHLVERFHRHLDVIKDDMEYIYSFRIDAPRRVRRSFLGLNVVGSYFYKPLFGLMDEEDALTIYNRINAIVAQQERHKVFIEDQLSIIRENVRITNATFTNFRNNIVTFKTEVEKLIEDQDKAMIKQMTKQYLISIATLMLIEHDQFMKKLKFVTSKAFNGDFTELVTINRFARDINKVNIFLGGERTIPTRNFDDIRAVSSIRHYLTENKIWIEISVPVIKKTPYVLTKLIAVPVVIGNNTILFDLHDNLFLVNERGLEYIPISETEIEKCQRAYDNHLICLPRKDTFLRNEEICESGILFGSEINNILRKCPFRYVRLSNFVRKLEEGSYYVYSAIPIKIREKCGDNPENKTLIIGRGIIKLAPHCDLQIGKIKIMSKNVFLSNETLQVDVPFQFRNVTNKIMNDLSLHKIPIKIPSLKFIDHEKEFRTISRSIENQEKALKQEISIEKFTDLPIFSFFGKILTPLAIVLILILIILKIYKKYCCCN